jgi:hypothetical protein
MIITAAQARADATCVIEYPVKFSLEGSLKHPRTL